MEECYPLGKNKEGHIGYAVIVNNYSFVMSGGVRGRKLATRKGSERDVENVRRSLTRVHFKVREPLVDLTAAQITHELAKIATSVDFKQYACLALVVMSHGNTRDRIYGTDGEWVLLDRDIVGPFREQAELRGKPKLCFVQACRGDDHTPTIEVEDEEADAVHMFDNAGRVYSEDNDDEEFFFESGEFVMTNVGDTLMHYATVERYVSIRHKIQGSCFIRSLCFVFDKYAANEPINILALLTKVNNIVAMTYKCQQPECKSSLNKAFVFNADQLQ
jgi:hypothetical protein